MKSNWRWLTTSWWNATQSELSSKGKTISSGQTTLRTWSGFMSVSSLRYAKTPRWKSLLRTNQSLISNLRMKTRSSLRTSAQLLCELLLYIKETLLIANIHCTELLQTIISKPASSPLNTFLINKVVRFQSSAEHFCTCFSVWPSFKSCCFIFCQFYCLQHSMNQWYVQTNDHLVKCH